MADKKTTAANDKVTALKEKHAGAIAKLTAGHAKKLEASQVKGNKNFITVVSDVAKLAALLEQVGGLIATSGLPAKVADKIKALLAKAGAVTSKHVPPVS